ncbi:unnamed protein product (macronuclear) [Paramecium tetraurelia]|uniref:Transmembrane protein n=1 Tax=Paramecium tetraurelia TaxID=5888 RepID=A0E7E5_PARTE|nr:uncharacterized protein GSPATT00023940001 [Paramecium tetraurelia]CAK91212.1 unnamed protein product [Paramecium tetraurelia]|eukprot:XP_001458609.1 hypothetical protein (macronuclear) [Paramecium tetraurelia strain d4-2]
MKNKTSITCIFLLCLGCLLVIQNYLDVSQELIKFQGQETNLQGLSEVSVDVCVDVDYQPSSNEISEAKRLREELLSTNKKIGLDILAENDGKLTSDQQEDAGQAAIAILLPWAILFVISLFTYITLLICCSNCCPCTCCRCTQAQKIDDIRIPLAFSIIFGVIILAFSIAGLALSEDVGNSLKSIRCAGYMIFSDINYGVIDSEDAEITRWKGLDSVINNITIIQNGLGGFVSDTQKQLDQINAKQLQDQYGELSDENKKIEAIPLTTYYGANDVLGYISTGKTVNSNSIATEIKQIPVLPQQQLFKQIYENIIKEIANIKSYGQQLGDQQGDISKSLEDTKKSIKDTQVNLINAAHDFLETTDSLENGSDLTSIVFYIIFGVFGLFALLIVVSSTLLCLGKGLKCFRCILVCACTFNFLFVLIGFILSAALGLTSGVLAEGCDYIDVILTNQTKFENLNYAIKDKEIKDIMTECLFKDGDILNYYNVYDSLKQAIDLDQSISDFEQQKAQFQSESAKGDAALQVNSDYIKSFITFERVDEEEYSTSNPANMKYLMREQVKTCNSNKKSSVPDKMSFCDTSAIQYLPSSGSTFSNPNNKPVCLQSSIFSADPTLLNQQISNCAEISTINQFYTTQSSKWKPVQDQEKSIINKHKQNQDALIAKFDAITSYTTAASNYLKSITDKNTGALSGVNCKFVQVSITRVQNVMCAQSFRLFYYFWIFFAIISISMWLSAISIFRVSIGIYYLSKGDAYLPGDYTNGQYTQGNVPIPIPQQDISLQQGLVQQGYVQQGYLQQGYVNQPAIQNNQYQPPQ